MTPDFAKQLSDLENMFNNILSLGPGPVVISKDQREALAEALAAWKDVNGAS